MASGNVQMYNEIFSDVFNDKSRFQLLFVFSALLKTFTREDLIILFFSAIRFVSCFQLCVEIDAYHLLNIQCSLNFSLVAYDKMNY